VESVALSHGEDHDLPVASLAAPKIADETDHETADEGEDDGDAESEDESERDE
jgi:large subunit ribosomal protein L25